MSLPVQFLNPISDAIQIKCKMIYLGNEEEELAKKLKVSGV